MNNYKQWMMDFYLKLLSISPDNLFRLRNQKLYASVRDAIAKEAGCEPEEIQNIFERMAQEDG